MDWLAGGAAGGGGGDPGKAPGNVAGAVVVAATRELAEAAGDGNFGGTTTGVAPNTGAPPNNDPPAPGAAAPVLWPRVKGEEAPPLAGAEPKMEPPPPVLLEMPMKPTGLGPLDAAGAPAPPKNAAAADAWPLALSAFLSATLSS